MNTGGAACPAALALIAEGTAACFRVVGRSLRVALSAVPIAGAIGLPPGARRVVARFSGRGDRLAAVNAPMGLSRGAVAPPRRAVVPARGDA